MKDNVLQIDAEPIGSGQERLCFLHPLQAGKVVKIQKGEQDKQTRRELEFYHKLERRGMSDFEHLPRYYGSVQTSRGQGFVVDHIADYDGEISQSLWWYFQRGFPLSEFMPYLEELRQYLLDNRIVFSVDMGRYNLLFQKISPQRARLVIIDGLGNHTAINWLDNIGWFERRKIRRRWRRFIGRLQFFSDRLMLELDGDPRRLEPAYRRVGIEL